MSGGVGQLDDENYPAITMGQAARLLGVQAAFLRSLDAAGILSPNRSEGGHRRYSRRQLETAARIRELIDEGVTVDSAARILDLQDQLSAARERIAELEHPSAAHRRMDVGPTGDGAEDEPGPHPTRRG